MIPQRKTYRDPLSVRRDALHIADRIRRIQQQSLGQGKQDDATTAESTGLCRGKEGGLPPSGYFRRWLPRMGYKKAVWAIAHRLCRLIWKDLHDGVAYVEKGFEPNPKALKERRRSLWLTSGNWATKSNSHRLLQDPS
jgi:hypothetical protein